MVLIGECRNTSELLNHEVFRELHSSAPVSGFTHNFYRYPARMSPSLAGAIISKYSAVGDVVLDPFVGGGTTAVEALANGRISIGLDINPLAVFVTRAKTTPISKNDLQVIENLPPQTSEFRGGYRSINGSHDDRLRNFPVELEQSFRALLSQINELRFARQRQFARCAALRIGQDLIDGKRNTQVVADLERIFVQKCREMSKGLETLVDSARANGVPKNQLTGQRLILLRSAEAVGMDKAVSLLPRPKLVLTSPPYPGVHVLYHRWQVSGRRETPAPYWIINQADGFKGSEFTMGGRTERGIDEYFRILAASYASIRQILADDAMVVQLVSFSDPAKQLPRFLNAMSTAGFEEDPSSINAREELWRSVPNRKWYCRVNSETKSARELLLIHRPA